MEITLDVLSHELMTLDDSPKAASSLAFRAAPLAAPSTQLRALAGLTGGAAASDFDRDAALAGAPALRPGALDIFQINVGKLCNMTCRHCHVDSGPDKVEENMDRATVDACLRALDQTSAHTVDLTGGAPELNPHFPYLVDQCVERGLHVIDRCNLTVLLVRRYEHLPQWLADRGVEVVCSLPHYRKMGTDAQRGRGTYAKSLEALRRLNAAGYGQGNPAKKLTLVTNPVGAFLAGSQKSLEAEWQAALERNHGVTFDRLLALNNMPISRYLEWLLDSGNLEAYMERLVNAFNPATLSGLMCRNTLSVSWDGRLYDCDFNQMLAMDLELDDGTRPTIFEFDAQRLQQRTIRTARHCYGCTAGAGSGCGGAIDD